MSKDHQLEHRLALIANDKQKMCNSDIEKCCWSVVHEHIHGFLPVEYDIREIDEELYLRVLELAREIV